MTTLSVFRLKLLEDGTVHIIDFGLPKEIKRNRILLQSDVPEWMMRAVCMLRIASSQQHVPGVGFKVNDHIYYIDDNPRLCEGESNEK